MAGVLTAPVRAVPSTRALQARWLVSPVYDLTFFIGSCVLSLGFYALYAYLQTRGVQIGGDSIIVTYFVFTALLDHPHIFQTFSRMYADKVEFQRRRITYTWGLAGFVAFGLLCVAWQIEAYLIVGAAIYGTWHIMRQHWGFMRIYKNLNKDLAPLDNHLDNWVFWTGMMSCFLYDYSDIQGPLIVYGHLTVEFPYVPPLLGLFGRGLFVTLLIGFAIRTIVKWRQGLPINLPKILLLVACLGTHYWIFFITTTPFLVAEALETAYHNVQYQGFIMHYQRKRFREIKWVVAKWFGAALVYGLLVGTVEIYGLLNYDWAMWIFAPFAMIVVFHYYMDGMIWRTREAPELREALFS